MLNRLTISRRKTPDLAHGSKNVRSLFDQMFSPEFDCAQAASKESSIWFANSGGVKTSSLDKFAMQVRTSGL